MKLSVKFQSLFALALASVASAAAAGSKEVIGALYSQTNANSGNALIVFDIYNDGTIGFNTSYTTGGNGGSHAYTTAQADALRSEGSVYVWQDRLFQVNAGSDTFGMWAIDQLNPSNLTLIGEPVNTNGEFPVSISAHPKTGQVCVANAGQNNGVQCFAQTQTGLTMMQQAGRPVGFVQMSPPVYSNASQSLSTVTFSPDGSKLLVDVKGLVIEGQPGFAVAWDVAADGSLSPVHETYSAPYKATNETGGAALNFGMSYLAEGHEGYIVADPSVGGIIYDFSKGYQQGQWRARNVYIDGQKTTSRVSYASKSKSYFFSDSTTQEVYEVCIDLNTYNSTVVNRFQIDPVNTVNTDLRVVTVGNNQYLYQLSPYGSLVTVFDIQPEGKTKIIQSYNFSQPLMNSGAPFTQYSPTGLHAHLKEGVVLP